MKDEPVIARVAALVGDPARANMLTALLDGHALTATELALEAGVTPQTASTHLARLVDGGLLTLTNQGRHRYFSLAGPHVAAMLEATAVVAEHRGPSRVRPGPRDRHMREARICYDHLAGHKAVMLMDTLRADGSLTGPDEALRLSEAGAGRFRSIGLDVTALKPGRRPLCRSCLDWSARRPHLAGALGAAFFDHIVDTGWARRSPESRVVQFSPKGEAEFARFVAVT